MFLLRDAIYLIELAFYCPLMPAIIFILVIHGFKSPYTWRPTVIPLFILSGMRIVNAALGLASMNPGMSDLLTTATLLDTIGLAPVLFVLVGLLVRANAPLYKGIPFWVFLPLQLTMIGATVMTAYGGRGLYTSGQHQNQDVTLMRAGIFIFIGIFTITIILAALTFMRVSRCHCHSTERVATACTLLCIPFMSIRLAFSAGSLFSSSETGDKGSQTVLNPMSDDNTDIWVHFLMVIVMEYVAALSATAVALAAKKKMVVPELEPGKVLDEDDEEGH